jgi:CRP-like cAMP-binding protein
MEVPADVLASLRANPVLATVSEEALGQIAQLVVRETRSKVGAALKGVDLFDGLSDEEFGDIQRIAEPVVLEAGAMLFEEGDPGDRFFVIVRGEVELTRRGAGDASERLAVLRAGQAFGEMALLNDVPRSASARITEQSYLIGIAREAFLTVLDADSLAARLLRNLARSLSATPVRLTHKEVRQSDTPREALAEYNRMVRGRLLPRGTPNLSGYDLAGHTAVDEDGEGSAAWDWFLLSDGRLALAVMKADQASLSSAYRLLSVRGLLRDFADDPLPGLGALLARVNRGLRAGWVEGISGSVSCGVLALSPDSVEWASAGSVAGTVVRADGRHDDLVPGHPALGSDDALEYGSTQIRLSAGDHLLVFSEGPSDSVISGRKFLATRSRSPGAKDRLERLVERLRESDEYVNGVFDVTAALVTRVASAEDEDGRKGSDAVARAAAAYDASIEEER